MILTPIFTNALNKQRKFILHNAPVFEFKLTTTLSILEDPVLKEEEEKKDDEMIEIFLIQNNGIFF
jgi:hypothetical protein